MSTRTPAPEPFATFEQADAERARLFRSGVRARVSLYREGWVVSLVEYEVSYVAQAA